jgi:hypothetical protein
VKRSELKKQINKYKWRAIGMIVVAAMGTAWCSTLAQVADLRTDLVAAEQLVSDGDSIAQLHAETIRQLLAAPPDTFYTPTPPAPPAEIRWRTRIDSFTVSVPVTVIDTLWRERSPVFLPAAPVTTAGMACEVVINENHAWYKPQATDLFWIGATALITSGINFWLYNINDDEPNQRNEEY